MILGYYLFLSNNFLMLNKFQIKTSFRRSILYFISPVLMFFFKQASEMQEKNTIRFFITHDINISKPYRLPEGLSTVSAPGFKALRQTQQLFMLSRTNENIYFYLALTYSNIIR